MALAPLDLDPPARKLRRFAAVATLVFGGLAACSLAQGQLFGATLGAAATPVAGALALLAGAMVVAAARLPALARPVWILLTLLTWPIGVVVSFVLLSLCWLCLFVPIGLALRLAGRDPLKRRSDPSLATYWTTRTPKRPADSYFRQF